MNRSILEANLSVLEEDLEDIVEYRKSDEYTKLTKRLRLLFDRQESAMFLYRCALADIIDEFYRQPYVPYNGGRSG